jgi:hypothetical protein
MATKRYDPAATDFNGRYARWVAALESGDDAELLEATVALPTSQQARAQEARRSGPRRARPDGAGGAEARDRAAQRDQRQPRQRRREREQAEQRRRDRTVRVERRVELPTTCARCGTKLKEVKTTGRPRLYCSPACRKAAYEDRRAHRDGAVKVQVVEKLITEVRERRIEVPHPRSDCINAVLADDDLMVSVIWTLTALVRDRTRKAYDPDQPKFKSLERHARALSEALDRRAGSAPSSP